MLAKRLTIAFKAFNDKDIAFNNERLKLRLLDTIEFLKPYKKILCKTYTAILKVFTYILKIYLDNFRNSVILLLDYDKGEKMNYYNSKYKELDNVTLTGQELQVLSFFPICQELQPDQKYNLDYDIFNKRFRLSDEAGNFVTDTKANFLKMNMIKTLKFIKEVI